MVVGDQHFQQYAANPARDGAALEMLHKPPAPAAAAIGRVNAEAAAPTFVAAHGQQGSAHALHPPLFLRHQDCTVFQVDVGTVQMPEHARRVQLHIVPVVGETAVEALAQGLALNRGTGYHGWLLRLGQVERASDG